MSALANTPVNKKRMNEQFDNRVEDDRVDISSKGISVIARIDYIQRFSKQMTVVVDKNPAVYSKVARQYLANLGQVSSNQEANVAFVAASSKINDIQMRCRLIEQLFANTLFDPEQSLAVSILRLAKKNNGIITVIVEHAQALSLQIKYELCQLVDTAKKTQNNINVVIFGLEQAAIEVGQNKTIFDKKTSIIDASSGQVIALDHARFEKKSTVFIKSIWLKIGLASFISLVIILASWFVLSDHESVNFAALPVTPPVNKNSETLLPQIRSVAQNNKIASVSDVHLAILGEDNGSNLLSAKAQRNDILQALIPTESVINNNQLAVNVKKADLITTKVQVTPAHVEPKNLKQENLNSSMVLPEILNEQYYLNSDEGYVVQITGFSEMSRLEAFIKNNNDLEYFSYQKNLNTQKFFVLTSEIYSDKTQARAAMNKLPQDIKDLGSFLKSVSTIKREINTVSQ